MDNPVDQVVAAINEADEEAAARRVAELQAKYPDATPDALVGMLIKQKCLQAGAIGNVTSSASAIPGVGVFVSLVFGVAADIGATAKMQTELVLEIAAAYNYHLTGAEKRSAVIMVTGMSAGANQLLEATGGDIAHNAHGRLTKPSSINRVPVLGVATSAGSNIVSTYVVGRRAAAYFGQGPEAFEDWRDNLRALVGVNERNVIAWLAETTEHSWRLVGDSALTAGSAVITAGKSAGEVVTMNAGRAGATVTEAGRGIAKGAGSAAVVVVGAGKAAGEGVTFGVEKVAEVATEAGRGVLWGAGAVVEAGKIAGEGVVAGAGKVGDIAASVFKRDRSGLEDNNPEP